MISAFFTALRGMTVDPMRSVESSASTSTGSVRARGFLRHVFANKRAPPIARCGEIAATGIFVISVTRTRIGISAHGMHEAAVIHGLRRTCHAFTASSP